MKKALSFLLALVMLLSVFAACSDPSDDNGTNDTNAGGEVGDNTDSADDSDERSTKLEIPEDTYNDYEFVILTPTVVTYNYSLCDFDEPSDDPYENAIYERNVAVEEMLQIKISEQNGTLGEGTYNLFKTSVDANTGDYDICFNNMQYSCTATGAGLCYSIEELHYVDLDKAWWNEDCSEQLAIGGQHYMIAGDIALSDKECIWAVFFIKELITANNLENPYELVKNNQWTWDKMMEMATTAVYDANGNSKLDSGDTFGLCTHSENYAAMWQSAGLKLITIDEDGVPRMSWDTEEFVTVFEALAAIMGNAECVSPEDDKFISTALMQGQTLFGTEVVAHVRNYRENDHDFGILPFPKYSTDVETYNSYIAVSSCVMTVGLDNDELYRTSAITEALAAKGHEILTPVYYDGQLSSKFARDEESGEMLDIIFEHRSYDLGVFFDWGSAYSALKDYEASPATLAPKLTKKIGKEIENTFEKLDLVF